MPSSPQETLEFMRRWEAEVTEAMPLEIKTSLDVFLPDLIGTLERVGLEDCPVETLERMTAHLMTWCVFHIRHRCGTGDLEHADHETAELALMAALRQWVGALGALRLRREVDEKGGSVTDLEALLALPAIETEE